MSKLKVFRTPVGFHDAYVAASSQKAALEAWGAEADLFARGVAERVADPALEALPLSRPGEVIKVLRDGEEGQFEGAAEERAVKRKVGSKKAPNVRPPPSPPARKPPRKAKKPRPSRDALSRLEAAMEEEEQSFQQALQALAAEEQELRSKRQMLRAKHEQFIQKQDAVLSKARADFRRRLEAWAREE